MIALVRLRPLALLTAAVLVAHGASLGGVFHFDDHPTLVDNPHIRSLASVPQLLTEPSRFSRNPGSDMFRPVVMTSYAVNYALGELDPRGYHALNLLVHLATSLVVFEALRRLRMSQPASLAAALLFAVHPLATQPINYVSSRSESLAALGAWLAVLLYLGHGGWQRAGSLVSYVFALGAKSVALWVAPALALHAVLTAERQAWKRQWPYWAVAAGYVALVRAQVAEAFVEAPVRELPVQLWTQSKALLYYVRLAIVPHPLTVEHDFAVSSSWTSAVVLLALLATASVALLAWRSRHRAAPVLLAGCALLVLIPTFVTPLSVLVSEQRLYAGLPALAGLVALCGVGRRHGRILVAVAAGLLAAASWQRSAAWADETSLWRDAASKSRHASRPHIQLGALARRHGDLTAAAAHLDTALQREPSSAAAHSNLGNVFLGWGRLREAEASYGRALQLLPRYPEALTNLGVLRGRQGRWGEALRLHQAALKVSPERPEVLGNAAVAMLELGRFAEAEELLRRVLGQGQHSASVLHSLGGSLEGQAKMASAVAAYEQATRLEPTYAKPYLALGRLYEQEARPQAAREAYATFLRLWRGEEQVAAAVRQRLREIGAR